MKEKILKLAKRLETFKLEDIQLISGFTEGEIFEILDELEERNQIRKLSSEKYIFVKSYFVGRLNVPEYIPEGIQLTDKDIEEYKKADRYAKKHADKYIKLIENSNGLNGKELKSFVEKWNNENPAMKTSVTRINAARKKLLEEGIKGLIGKNFKALSERKKINEQIYEYFREFYLFPKQLKSSQALELAVEKYSNDHNEFDLSTLAQAKTYRKRLQSEYTVEQINFYRYNYISTGVSDSLKRYSSEAK